MKHIKTASDAETSMRKAHPVVKSSKPLVADISNKNDVKELIDVIRQIDLLTLRASELKGSIMGYMQGHDTLVDADGNKLVVWAAGSTKDVIDYAGLLDELNATTEQIAKYTTKKTGGRVFSVVCD